MFIIVGLVVIASAVAVAEYLGKSKSEYALKGLWVWLAASAANLVYEVGVLGHSIPSALGTFAAIFCIPAVIAIFFWRYFKIL